ncbi:MAG: hypothetical protein AAFZ87_11730 [Planctomycetota bacterium]
MSRPSRRNAPPSAAQALILALCLVAIWGHYSESGASDPAAPGTLVLEREGHVFGNWAYFRHTEEDGFALRTPGLLIGLFASAAAVALALRLVGGSKNPPVESEGTTA